MRGRVAFFHGDVEVPYEQHDYMRQDSSARFIPDDGGDGIACPFCHGAMDSVEVPMPPHMRDYGLALR